MPNNGTRRAVSYGNMTFHNNNRNRNNITNWKQVPSYVSHTTKRKSGLRNLSPNQEYFNLITKRNKLPGVKTEEEYLANMEKNIEEGREAVARGNLSQENFNSVTQNMMNSWKSNMAKAQRLRQSKLNIIQKNLRGHNTRRLNAQRLSSNFAKMVANVELNNTNVNANYKRKVRNAINRNFNSRKNTMRKKYFNREFEKMFGL